MSEPEVVDLEPPEYRPKGVCYIEFVSFEDLISESVQYWNANKNWPDEISPEKEAVTTEDALSRWPEPFQADTDTLLEVIRFGAKDDLSDDEMEKLEERIIDALVHEELHQTLAHVVGYQTSVSLDNIEIFK